MMNSIVRNTKIFRLNKSSVGVWFKIIINLKNMVGKKTKSRLNGIELNIVRQMFVHFIVANIELRRPWAALKTEKLPCQLIQLS